MQLFTKKIIDELYMRSDFDKSLLLPETKSTDITMESTGSVLKKHHNDFSVNEDSLTEKVYQNSQPEKSFVLNLKLIIDENTDVGFHGRVGAYFDRNLQKSPKDKNIFNNRISFTDYVKYITEDLNAHQRKKYQLIERLVELLSPAFANESRSTASYNQFCHELIQIIELCMSTTEESLVHNKTSTSKTLSENVAIFWRGILLEVKLSDQTLINYENILNMLVVSVEKGVLMALKLQEIMKQFNQAKKDNPLSCFSWDYFNIICDANNLLGHHITQFVLNYQKACDGLAAQFVYLPHLWTFIRNELENVEQSSEYREKLKKIDKMFLNLPAFHDFHPQDKGRGLNQFMKLTIS